MSIMDWISTRKSVVRKKKNYKPMGGRRNNTRPLYIPPKEINMHHSTPEARNAMDIIKRYFGKSYYNALDGFDVIALDEDLKKDSRYADDMSMEDFLTRFYPIGVAKAVRTAIDITSMPGGK